MLRWVVILLILAVISAIFGFGRLAEGFADIAEILFYVFIVLFGISFVVHLLKRA